MELGDAYKLSELVRNLITKVFESDRMKRMAILSQEDKDFLNIESMLGEMVVRALRRMLRVRKVSIINFDSKLFVCLAS